MLAESFQYIFINLYILFSSCEEKKNKQLNSLYSALMNLSHWFSVKWNTTWILNPILTFKCSRGSCLCQHSSCAQQAALTTAEDSGGHPEDGFFISKPPKPKSQEVRWRHAEKQMVKKTPHISLTQPLLISNHRLCTHCSESWMRCLLYYHVFFVFSI